LVGRVVHTYNPGFSEDRGNLRPAQSKI
jgi:hypothetical protein